MPEWVKRLGDEYNEHMKKVKNLSEFLETQVFADLPDEEQAMLVCQGNAMALYGYFLLQRYQYYTAKYS